MVPKSWSSSNIALLSVAKTITSASMRSTFSAEISACEPSSGAYGSRPGVRVKPSIERNSVLRPAG